MPKSLIRLVAMYTNVVILQLKIKQKIIYIFFPMIYRQSLEKIAFGNFTSHSSLSLWGHRNEIVGLTFPRDLGHGLFF